MKQKSSKTICLWILLALLCIFVCGCAGTGECAGTPSDLRGLVGMSPNTVDGTTGSGSGNPLRNRLNTKSQQGGTHPGSPIDQMNEDIEDQLGDHDSADNANGKGAGPYPKQQSSEGEGSQRRQCPSCHGTGLIDSNTCPTCNGLKYVTN